MAKATNPDHMKNLVSIKKGDTRIPRLGGLSRSPKKKLGAKIRWMRQKIAKEGKLSNADQEWLYARLEDPEVMDLDMLNWLDKLRAASPDEQFDGKLLTLYTHIKKAIHPEKKQLDIRMTTVDLNEPLTDDVRARLLEDLK